MMANWLKKQIVVGHAALMLAGMLSAESPQPPEWTMIFPNGALTHLQLLNGDLVTFAGWTRGYGIMRFDIANPEQPGLKFGIPLPGYVHAPVFKGDTMYVGSTFGFFVMDTAGGKLELKRNLLMDFLPKSAPGRGAFMAGNKLLLAGKSSNRLFDISKPSQPVIAKFDFASGVKNIFTARGRFFSYSGNVISELTGAGELKPFATLDAPIRALMAVDDQDDNMLLVRDRGNNLTLYAMNANSVSKKAQAEGVLALQKTSGGIFMRTQEKLCLLEDLAKGTLQVSRSFLMPKDVAPQFEFDGKHFFFRETDYNRTISIRDADSPELRVVATIPLCRSDGSMEVTEHAIYTSSGTQLLAFDKKNPDANGRADFALNVDFSGSSDAQRGDKASFKAYNLLTPSGLKSFGNYLLFAGALIDIRKPLEPAFVTIVTERHLGVSTDGARSAFAQGGQITVADTSSLPELKVLGSYECQKGQGPMLDVILRADRLYAIDPNCFYIFDTSDFGEIKLLETREVDNPCSIAAIDDTIYIPAGIRNTADAKSMLAYSAATGVFSEWKGFVRDGVVAVAVDGNQLFIGDGGLVRQFDCSEPLNPLPVAEYSVLQKGSPDQRSSLTELHVDGDRLYSKKYSRLNAWKIVDIEER